MIMLSTALGVALAFLLGGTVSLQAGFSYVLVVFILTVIHMYVQGENRASIDKKVI